MILKHLNVLQKKGGPLAVWPCAAKYPKWHCFICFVFSSECFGVAFVYNILCVSCNGMPGLHLTQLEVGQGSAGNMGSGVQLTKVNLCTATYNLYKL